MLTYFQVKITRTYLLNHNDKMPCSMFKRLEFPGASPHGPPLGHCLCSPKPPGRRPAQICSTSDLEEPPPPFLNQPV